MKAALLISAVAAVNFTKDDAISFLRGGASNGSGPCCTSCTDGTSPFQSIHPDDKTHQCGVCCIKPSALSYWQKFDKYLTAGDCKSDGYTIYIGTKTEGVYPISIQVDRYVKPGQGEIDVETYLKTPQISFSDIIQAFI